MQPLISSKRISEILFECLFTPEELDNMGNPKPWIKWTEANGLALKLGFVNERLEKNKEEIQSILRNLDPSFFEPEGMSFLNFCQDRNGILWGGILTVIT